MRRNPHVFFGSPTLYCVPIVLNGALPAAERRDCAWLCHPALGTLGASFVSDQRSSDSKVISNPTEQLLPWVACSLESGGVLFMGNRMCMVYMSNVSQLHTKGRYLGWNRLELHGGGGRCHMKSKQDGGGCILVFRSHKRQLQQNKRGSKEGEHHLLGSLSSFPIRKLC